MNTPATGPGRSPGAPGPLSVLAAAALLLAWPPPAGAQDEAITVYRCTGTAGAVSLRDTPCEPGEREQALRMQRPVDPPPAPAAAVAPPAPGPTAAPAVPPVVLVVQSAPVYECTTPDGETYTSSSDAGNPRWVPLWTLGYPAWTAGPHRPGLRPPLRAPVRPDTARRGGDGGRVRGHLDNGLVFDGIGRPTPRAPGDPDRAPALPPAVGLARSAGSWVRDDCRPLPQAEVCQRLHDRDWQLRRRYNSALQSERRDIDAERRTIAARLDAECAGG